MREWNGLFYTSYSFAAVSGGYADFSAGAGVNLAKIAAIPTLILLTRLRMFHISDPGRGTGAPMA